MTDKKFEKAAQITADEARQQKMTVSDLFYRLLEKSEVVTKTESDVVLRACDILEKKKP